MDWKWERVERTPPQQKVTFVLALNQRNIDLLEANLMEISNPRSPRYGMYMTRKEVTDLIAPPYEVQRQILNWIHDTASQIGKEHLFEVVNNKDAIIVTGTATFVEAIFHTEIHTFKHSESKLVVMKHLGYILPRFFS
jgi:subtilase family serine protease